MKTILVATDFSAPASNALDFAAHIAQATQAELILFNAYRPNVHVSNSVVSASSRDHIIEKDKNRLMELANETATKYGINTSYEMRQSDAVQSLSEFTRDHNVEMVVMGIESNKLEYKLFGNTTTEAIKLMQFPLLIVPNDAQFSDLKNITYACEISYLKDGDELGLLKELVRTFEGQLEVLHVNTTASDDDSNEAYEQRLDAILGDVDHAYAYIKHPGVLEGINERLAVSEPNMLVMLHHRQGFIQNLFKGSHSDRMTVQTRIPLLVIPNEGA